MVELIEGTFMTSSKAVLLTSIAPSLVEKQGLVSTPSTTAISGVMATDSVCCHVGYVCILQCCFS